jgi:hypothetical protein
MYYWHWKLRQKIGIKNQWKENGIHENVFYAMQKIPSK